MESCEATSFSPHLFLRPKKNPLCFFLKSLVTSEKAFSASVFPYNLGLYMTSTQALTLYDLLTPVSNTANFELTHYSTFSRALAYLTR